MSMEERKYFLIPEGTPTHASYMAWRQHCKAVRDKWWPWALQFGHTNVVVHRNQGYDAILAGLLVSGPCPAGWRRRKSSGEDFWSPTRQTKVGRAQVAEMRKLDIAGWKVPGVQSMCVAGGRVYGISYGMLTDKLVVSVHKEAVVNNPDATPLRLSEFALLLEQQEALAATASQTEQAPAQSAGAMEQTCVTNEPASVQT
jgi:hypothetical protein